MRHRRAIDLAVVGGLALAVGTVYLQVRGHAFVNFDDPLYVTANPVVRRGLSWEGVRWAATALAAQNWHPVTWLSHMLDVSCFGLDAGAHLLVNVAWHALDSVLVYALWRTTTAQPWPSAFVAASFALHPAHVESVAWLSERKDVLSTALGLVAMLAWVAWTRRPSAARYAAVLVALGLGLMAKPMLVSLPLVLVLLDWWPLARLRERGWRVLGEKVPLLVLVASASVATLIAQSQGGAVASVTRLPLGERMANAALAYVRYLGVLLWPVDLALIYPLEIPVPRASAAAAALLLVALTVLALRAAGRRPYLLVGWLWYLVTLAPVIGIVQVGEQAMADRYTYLPFVGLFVGVAFGGAELVAVRRALRPLAIALAGIALGACTVLSYRQTARWKDSETIFRHTLAVTRNNHLAHQGLALALAAGGRYAEAVAEHRAAARAWPEYFDAHWGAAVLLERMGRREEAVEDFAQAARLRPEAHVVRYGYAKALLAAGRQAEALDELRAAVRLAPGWPPAVTLLAWTLATRPDRPPHEYEEAVAVAERGVAGPGAGDPDLLDALGAAYAATRQFERAQAAAARAAAAARDAGRLELAAAIEERRTLYARHEPYREE